MDFNPVLIISLQHKQTFHCMLGEAALLYFQHGLAFVALKHTFCRCGIPPLLHRCAKCFLCCHSKPCHVDLLPYSAFRPCALLTEFTVHQTKASSEESHAIFHITPIYRLGKSHLDNISCSITLFMMTWDVSG